MSKSMAAHLWQMALLQGSLRTNSEGGKKNLWRSIILKKKWFLSARYLELQTAQSWDNILRKYCYFLVLFFHHFLGTGYWPLIETGHCRDRSFVWPSTATLGSSAVERILTSTVSLQGITITIPLSIAFLCLKPSWQCSPSYTFNTTLA